MQKLQGYAEQGNTSLTISGAAGTITQKVQGSFPSCTCTVYVTDSQSLASGTYTSGGTITGSAGQTVILTFASGGTASVALTGVNTIAGGTALTITAAGAGFASAPTSATLSSGTATASGTAVVTSVLTNTVATIYSDNATSPTAKANPFTASADGSWFFYAANGHYDVRFSGTGITTPFTLGDFTLFYDTVTRINAKNAPYNATGNGTTDDTAAIVAANTAAGATGTLYIPAGTHKINDITLTAHVVCDGVFSINTGQVLTINGPFEAGLYQVFSGAGSVVFGSKAVSWAHPEWWATNTTPGTTDMTAAIQKAMAAHKNVELAATGYNVTDTIVFSNGHQLKGQNKFSGYAYHTPQPYETYINFNSTSAKDLFDLDTNKSAYVFRAYIGGIHIVGNSAADGTGSQYSRYALYNSAAQSLFENLYISNFQVAIYENFAMLNKHKDITLAFMSTACINTSQRSDAIYSTTDIFDNVQMQLSPWGAILRYGYAFRFINCEFEALSVGGANIYKDVISASFTDCYGENVPSTVGGNSYGMFRVNKDGTTASARGSVSIKGGHYQGTGNLWGSFLDVGVASLSQRVSVVGVSYSSFSVGIIRDGALTATGGVYEAGNSVAQLTTLYSGTPTENTILRTTKISIEDGTTASTLKVTASSVWQGDTSSVQDNLAKSGSSGDGHWSLDANGQFLSFLNTAISGDCVAVVSVHLAYNNTTVPVMVDAYKYASGIYIVVRDSATGATKDLTALVGSGVYLEVTIAYYTTL